MTRKNIFSICLVELQTIRGFSRRHGLLCKAYEKQPPKNPVIILLDNDTGPSDFINQIIKDYSHLPKKAEDVRKGRFIT
ncbi:hypothetical protein MUTS15_29920 [Escherichia coli]|nr:hypothetical protein MUTS15_29920 [Escherichia coli]